MNKIYMTCGLPASGKSTWAKQFVMDSNGKVKRINKDDLRLLVDAGIWSQENEKFILKLRDNFIRLAISNKFDVVVDDTNLSPKHHTQLHALAQELKAELVVKDFRDVSVNECIRRDKNRANYVGEDVIKDMYKRYIEVRTVNKITAPALVPGVAFAILVDLDGTVALMNGRSPFDEAKADTDNVNEPVAEIVKRYAASGIRIIFCSGRDEGRGRAATVSWLQSNGFTYDHLFMRPAGDMRKDAIVKREIYDLYIKGKYNVMFVLDDRNAVVQQWRELGLTCLQVAPGDF